MRHILFMLIVFFCLFVACVNEVKSTKGLFQEHDLHGMLYENAEIFATFPDIIDMDSLIIAYSANPNVSGRFITAYSPRQGMKEVGAYGTAGRGPGEFIAIQLNSVHGNRLFVRNINMNELAVLELVSDSGRVEIKEMERLKHESIMYDNTAFEDRTISYLDDGHFVAISFGGPGKFFSLYDDRMNWLAHSGDGPLEGEDVEVMNARSRLDGHLATDNGVLVYLAATIPKIMFYKREGDVLCKEWEDTFYDSYYQIENKQIEFDHDKTVGIVRGVELGEKYVYVLFLDVTWGEYYKNGGPSAGNIVFVFDHQGNRIARLNLNYRLQDLCVSRDEKTLYGIADPEYVIAAFDLPDFEK